jgi:molecular chaperone GrpE
MDMSDTIEDSPAQTAGNQADASQSSLEAVTLERDNLLADRAELQDRLLRRQAEFDNFRRRTEREKSEAIEYANTETLRDLLPVIDDLERALKAETTDKEYAKGMDLIYQRLSDSLKKLGLEPIETMGQTFDPHVHHAVEMVETSDQEDHAILDEYQRGYNFKGRLLRPAMVKVAVKKT